MKKLISIIVLFLSLNACEKSADKDWESIETALTEVVATCHMYDSGPVFDEKLLKKSTELTRDFFTTYPDDIRAKLILGNFFNEELHICFTPCFTKIKGIEMSYFGRVKKK